MQVHLLANELVRRGHVLTCHSFSPRPDDALYNHVQVRRGSGRAITGKFEPAIRFRRVSTDTFDVVHFHGDDYLTGGYACTVRTFYGSAFYEALYATRIPRALYQALFYVFECVSSMRRQEKVAISRSGGFPIPGISRVIPCGVSLQRFYPPPQRPAPPTLLFLGDMYSRKQGVLVWRAFTEYVRPRFADAVLIVVGPEPVDGTGIEHYRQVSAPRLAALYRRAWVYCMTSSWEGFGVPVLEAMASGCAVVAMRNQAIERIVHPNADALLCTSYEEFGETLCRCLGDTDMRTRLTRRAVQTVQSYRIEDTAAAYERLYTHIVSGHRGTPVTGDTQ